MSPTKISQEPANNSDCMSNVWPSGNHSIHKWTTSWCLTGMPCAMVSNSYNRERYALLNKYHWGRHNLITWHKLSHHKGYCLTEVFNLMRKITPHKLISSYTCKNTTAKAACLKFFIFHAIKFSILSDSPVESSDISCQRNSILQVGTAMFRNLESKKEKKRNIY